MHGLRLCLNNSVHNLPHLRLDWQHFFAVDIPDYNNEMVFNLLATVDLIHANGSSYAFFDLDNTCMFGDISYTSMLHQVKKLHFGFGRKNSRLFSCSNLKLVSTAVASV